MAYYPATTHAILVRGSKRSVQAGTFGYARRIVPVSLRTTLLILLLGWGLHPIPATAQDGPVVPPRRPVQFLDQSTWNPTSWSWDFDYDPLVPAVFDSFEQNPIHIFPQEGAYLVLLEACNGGACDTIVKEVVVARTPIFSDDFESGNVSAWGATGGGGP